MTGRAMLMSDQKLLAEVAKCDVVCANCHRARTKRLLDVRFSTQPLTGKSRYVERHRARWRSHQKLLDDLRRVPCLDCHKFFPTYAMEFDHRDPTQKRSGVTRLIGRTSTEKLLAEAAKCDIVCANCHRMRTYRRREAPIERE
jgi:formate-dependent nitrite reductase cytochrome c552 subunit